jgi:hypothetical protein
MAKYMTILDAVDAFDLYDVFDEILDAHETDFYARSEIETELRDLIEEHDETYEFTRDEDGGYAESMERNLKEALTSIFDEYGLEHLFDDEFAEDAMDDEDIAGIYNDGPEGEYDTLDPGDDGLGPDEDGSLF